MPANLDENPVYETIDGLAPPHRQDQFFGHDEAERALMDAWNSGKMHHAWLLTGPKGIGKATFAYRAARYVFHQGADGAGGLIAPDNMDIHPESQTARLVANQSHPNLLTIDRPYDAKAKRFKTEITVDEVRKTVRFFGSTAGENTWRVCIVDPADDLNGNAANALLKILEEPPERTVFFLISHAPGRLLPTIRSRCRRLSLAPLEGQTLNNALTGLEICEADKAAQLGQACTGSLRKAAELQSDDGLILVHAFERLLQPPFNPDYESLNKFADLVAQRGKDHHFNTFSDLTHRYLSSLLHSRAKSGNALPEDLNKLATSWDKAESRIRETRIFNLDKKQAAIDIVRDLALASRMPGQGS